MQQFPGTLQPIFIQQGMPRLHHLNPLQGHAMTIFGNDQSGAQRVSHQRFQRLCHGGGSFPESHYHKTPRFRQGNGLFPNVQHITFPPHLVANQSMGLYGFNGRLNHAPGVFF